MRLSHTGICALVDRIAEDRGKMEVGRRSRAATQGPLEGAGGASLSACRCRGHSGTREGGRRSLAASEGRRAGRTTFRVRGTVDGRERITSIWAAMAGVNDRYKRDCRSVTVSSGGREA